jgi:hypothetical protein
MRMLIPEATALPAADIGKIREVFLSATAKDLVHVRNAVKEALDHARTAVYLQEYWNRAAGDTVKACLDVLQMSTGYIGIFGCRYGWVPPGYECSITELEREWALQRWRAVDPPPVFLFAPEPSSPAAQDLLAAAERALSNEFPDQPALREQSKQLQARFIEKVRSGNIILNFFSSVQDLEKRAIIAVMLWNNELFEEALRGRRRASSYTIPPAELGAIGRKAQFDALEDAILALGDRDDAPALCVVVHGHPNSGLSEFRACLASWEGWGDLGRDVEPGCPSGDSYKCSSLIKWALEMVGSASAGAEIGAEALAAALARRLAQMPVVLLLQDLDRLDGGLPAFHRDFWCPLLVALEACWKPGSHRLMMVAITCVSPPPGAGYVGTGRLDDPDLDYMGLLVLPSLGNLTADDIEEWLRQHRVPRARYIAERVIGTGAPFEVYDALQRNGFWKQVIEKRP